MKIVGGSLHSIVRLPVLQRLPLLLRLVLHVVPLLQASQHQAVEDVPVGLLDELLEQPQGHDADLEDRGGDESPNAAVDLLTNNRKGDLIHICRTIKTFNNLQELTFPLRSDRIKNMYLNRKHF